MNNTDNLKPEVPDTVGDSTARTWQDDLAGQPEVEGTGPHGERALSDEARALDNLRARIG